MEANTCGRVSTAVRTTRRGVLPVLLSSAVLLVPLLAAAALPVPANCQHDSHGANDYPNQRDLTEMCVALGDAAPWDLVTSISLDELNVQGTGGSLDACTLLDVDVDAAADFAVCFTLRSSGPENENRPYLAEVRLFGCADTKADRCMGPVPLAGPYSTVCELSFPDDDPFSPAAPDGPGDHYPFDSKVTCAIDYADFGNPAGMHLLDGCSFPSMSPNSDPADCILFTSCASALDCDDGNACTADACLGGFCRHEADPAAACSDSLFCNGAEICNALGYCENAGAPEACDDGIACTIDDCDELTNSCIHDPRSSLCDDDAWCNGAETCDSDVGCVAGLAPDCGDTVACTTDACNEATDSCDHTPDDAACNDGQWCNGPATCDADAGCVAGAAPDCADAVDCTIDACDEATDSCRHEPNDAACDDGSFCNGTEVCDVLGGCAAGPATDCDDGVDCTTDACSEAADLCLHEPNHAACDDGTWCNGTETCTSDGCDPGEPPCEAPAVCDESVDRCIRCLADADCNDGVFCNGPETCNAGTGLCSAGSPVDCDDGVACTLDSCDAGAGACAHQPADALCSNGLFCDGDEICSPAAGCVPGATSGCDDGIGCTIDTCNEATDSCRHEADDARCDDGLYCNGIEFCIAGYGCDEGEPVTCRADRYECSIESCNETTDGCVSDFSRCVCGDSELVPGEDCEPPALAGTFEDCNNLIDDDGDGAADCMDPDCAADSPRGKVCDENCDIDLLCAPIGRDPAIIKFEHGRRPDSLWIHGHFVVESAPDPRIEGLALEISNGQQPVFFAALEAGDLEGSAADATRFKFRDKAARQLGQASARGGLESVRVEYRELDGVPILAFRIRAYGDFAAATDRRMTTQISVGGEVGSLNAEWSAKKRKWLLRQSDF